MEPTIPAGTLATPDFVAPTYGASHLHDRDAVLELSEHARAQLLRSRECRTVPEALQLQALCRYEPALLPRYHQDDRGWNNRSRGYHQLAEPGAYSTVQAWLSRDDWLDVVVDVVTRLRPQVLRKHYVGVSMMRRWAAVKSAYAQRWTGRRCIVRPKVLAGALACQERQVKRCNAAARELGLEIVVVRGRMLTYDESTECRRRGSTQRGLASEVALTVPGWALQAVEQARTGLRPQALSGPGSVDSDTPTSGGLNPKKSHLRRTNPCAAGGARTDGATRRHPTKQVPSPTAAAHGSATMTLARNLVDLVPWLRRESPQRISSAVAPFARAALPWTAHDLQFAMGAQARRNDGQAHITPGRTRMPWALLRHVLAQIDPYADHPRLPELETTTWTQPTDPCEHPDCDGHGWHNTPTGATRCPHRHP